MHNIRGARDVTFHPRLFSALIGPNNAGKTTLLDAIRLFYGTLAWDERRDRPWRDTSDPSWVEITYAVEPAEADQLVLHSDDVEQSAADRDEGVSGTSLLEDGMLSVRRYLSQDGRHAAGEFYFVPPGGGELLPTGWEATSGKLGQCVYVPITTRTKDHTSSSEPSPLRDILVMAFDGSVTDNLVASVSSGVRALRDMLARGPLTALENRLDDALSPWQLTAKVDFGTVSAEFIMRHLVELQLRQDGEARPAESQGAGVQRTLIAALIQAAAGLRSQAKDNPFRWILFEEPEAFLHPAQVSRLAQDLRELTKSGNTAVTISTHDPTALSVAEVPPEGITRVHRVVGRIKASSPAPDRTAEIIDAVGYRSAYAQASQTCFKSFRKPDPTQEYTRVLYDLDPRSAAAFFADQVVVVEGSSDALLFEWLNRRGHLTSIGPNVGVFDAGGKFELHRASATLSLAGVPHVVLWDEDAARRQPGTNEYKNNHCRDNAALAALSAAACDQGSTCKGGVRLDGTIEQWLGITEEKSRPWKAASIAEALGAAYHAEESPVRTRTEALVALLRDLFDDIDPNLYAADPAFSDSMIIRRFTPPEIDFVFEVCSAPKRLRCTC
ncbi:ATP-dependent nuclease [Actinomadura logoneensis]|uniref:ATP-dependent nuclease n=1 Tax=Actinomadura logoneensis TaxID=2293572 RepID=UPI0013140DBB|nr:ATP-binding protein [Actinomadura logoneensis]